MSHCFHYRVSPADTDAGGIVYYVNYLKIAERAREALLAEFQLDAAALAAQAEPLQLTVASCEVKYAASARLGDQLTVVTECAGVQAERVRLSQRVLGGEQLLAAIAVELSCIALASKQSRPLPAAIAALFQH